MIPTPQPGTAQRALTFITVLLLAAAMAVPVGALAQWERIDWTPPSGIVVHDVRFVNDSVGYLACALGGRGLLLQSTDFGESWTEIYGDSSFFAFSRVRPLTRDVIHVVAHARAGGARPVGEHVLRSVDGGASFTEIFTPSRVGADDYENTIRVLDVSFLDTLNGFLVLDAPVEPGHYAGLRRTTDGGRTWTTVLRRNPYFKFREDHYRRGSISMSTRLDGVAMLSTGTLYRTTDGGTRWDSIRVLHPQTSQIISTSPSVVYARFEQRFSTEFDDVIRSGDSGSTWTGLTQAIRAGVPGLTYDFDILSMQFVDDSVGYAGGSAFFGASLGKRTAFFVRTTDAGRTWVASTTGGSPNYAIDRGEPLGMHFPTPDRGYASSPSGALWRLPCRREGGSIEASRTPVFDQGDSVVLTLPEIPGSIGYRWSTGATSRSITARATGRYVGRVLFDRRCETYYFIDVTARPLATRDSGGVTHCNDCSTIALDARERVIFSGCPIELSVFDTAFAYRRWWFWRPGPDDWVFNAHLVADDLGGAYAAAAISRTQSVLVRYDEQGAPRTLRSIDRGDLDNRALVASVRGGGALFGYTSWSQEHVSYALHVERLDARGTVMWTHVEGAFAAGANIPAGIAIDRGGIARVASTVSASGGVDARVVALDAGGGVAWRDSYGRGSGSRDVIDAFACDSSGNAFVSGLSYADDTVRFFYRLDSAGNRAWLHLLSPSARALIAPDGAGAAYLAVDHSSGRSPAGEAAVRRYRSDGLVLWERRLTLDSTDFTELSDLISVTAIATDTSGSLYVAGPTPRSFRVERLDGNGRKRWSVSHDDGASSSRPIAMTVARDGSVYVLDHDIGNADRDCRVTKLTQRIGVARADVREVPITSGRPSITIRTSAGLATFEFVLEHAATVELDVVDLRGTVVAHETRDLIAGAHRVGLSTSDLPTGVYHGIIRTGRESMSAKVLVLR
jgi:photosystem II stability/assembly factor-like uncharacterized protein